MTTTALETPVQSRRWWKAVLLVVGIFLAVVELRGHLPSMSETWAVLRGADPLWMLAAAALQIMSMCAFGEQQRRLLAAFGVRMPAAASIAVSYARTAMTTALPGGSAVSAGYAFRQFRARGASQPVAAAVMLLSGVASVVGLVVLYGADLLALTSPSPLVLTGIAAGAVALVVYVAHRLRTAEPGDPTVPAAQATEGSAVRRLRQTLVHTARLARTVPARQWFAVIGIAVVNWLTDLACLLVSVHAVGLSVPTQTVATAYLVAQLVRQIPATPGGIGVIEASLILALTTAGAAQAPAAAAVLIYRLLSCWTVLPIGLICWTTQKQAVNQTELTEPEMSNA